MESALALHQWDERTSMPPGGHGGRVAITAHLSELIHRAYIDERLADAARRVIETPADEDELLLARAVVRRIARLQAVPTGLAAALSSARSECVRAWHAGRAADDSRKWTDSFAHLLSLLIEEASAYSDGRDIYSRMLDRYEPGLTAARLSDLVDAVAGPLRALREGVIDRAGHSGRDGMGAATSWPMSLRDQRRLCAELRAWVGLDSDRLRVGETDHPFALLIAPGDVGIAIRYDAADAATALHATLHEAGHALYMQNIPADLLWFGIDEEGASHGIHESQSRFWENFVGRSRAFAPVLRSAADRIGAAGNRAADDHDGTCRVTDTVVRVGSDELSYNLHIAFRVDLEARLVRGDLLPRDLPAAWADACESAIGRRPSGARDGVLQDIHWSSGIVGGFACYLMGNLYAAGLHDAMGGDLGPIDRLIAAGGQHEIGRWLCNRIHRHGRRYAPSDLYCRATGSELGVGPLLEYLSGKWHAT
ncbi:MAG: hypothetical protein EA382_01795 [Spirochaetaceae bacterium]|nr:MAG: hypothetical protein EA382_01795 [Spirochaetaceae bacterium]